IGSSRILMRMRFAQDSADGAHQIRAYADGEFRVGERRVQGAMILSATEILEAPELHTVADIGAAHVARILALDPAVVLLGTGAVQRFPEPWLAAQFWSKNIGFEVMDTGAACRTFNVLVAERRRAVAALLP
ncbi:MAG TPA: MTH938/NDUFAF3 family protein, partial [Steroidobacteraceae bacterium]|nr:MTH938/NDUFAF3 family protein [Steroidobacteraceae bacterium]